MDTALKKIIDETIEQFFENAPIKMIEKGVREETFDVCPHCKKEIYEKHEYTEDGGKTWRHSDCKGLIRRPPLDPASIPVWLRPYMDKSLNEYFGSDPSKIGIDSGEKKYSKQEPGGQMAAVNCNETAFRVYNETLCPALWDEQQHLDPEVRLNLLRMAQDFYEKTKFTAPILDVYLMGSIANYNWTPDSDADVHVIIDFTQLQMPNETASKVAKSAGAQWNLEHNATVKGHKVEINIQSVKAEKPHVTGIYSLMKDAWIRKPTKINVQVNKPLIQVHYTEIKKFVESAIQSGDRERMKTAKDYLDDYRQHGLDTAGELSTQNIVYKILRAKGLIKTLKDSIITAYDKEMSVDEADVPTMTKKDYIGSIIDGEVRGEPVPAGKVKFYMHNDFPGLISGMNSTNWRYNAEKNRVLWNTQPEEESKVKVTDFLAKRGIVNPIHKNMYKFEEVTQADIKARHPHPFAPQKLSPDNELVPDLEMMTLDNLKALMKKAGREWRYARAHEDSEGCKRALEKSKLFHDEIKSRLAYINKPVAENSGEAKIQQIKQHLPSITPDKIQIVVQKDDEYPDSNYVQIDGIGEHDSVFSTNPEQLIKLGVNIPDTNTFLKLPLGRYRLPDALKKLGLNEGFGWGHSPEKDRLSIPDHRWQIRSKDAPKTPKMKEDYSPRYVDSSPKLTTPVDKSRTDFSDESPNSVPDKVGKEIKGIIADAEKILDKMFQRGAKYITVQYMIEVFDDLYAIHVPLPKTSKVYPQMRDSVIMWLARDYDIRNNGKRIGEQLNEAEQKVINELVDQVIAGML